MATELENTVRQYWAWRRRGKVRWLPLPVDTIDIPDMYLIAGFFFVLSCVETEFEADLRTDLEDTFFNIADDVQEFASIAWYTNVDQETYILAGIFDDPYEDSNPDNAIGLQSIGPTFKCELAKIINTPRKDDSIKVCVRGVNRRFKVIESRPDGTGLTVLILHKL